MFRKALMPALAIAMLSGCATDYAYRNGNGNGNGDYYYGQPQVEYRYIGGYGAYGGYGGVGYGLGYGNPVYYYDRFGRLVYGYPYGYAGAPYAGGYWQHRPRRPSQDHDDDHQQDNGNDHPGDNRRPPWRNIGGMLPRTPEGGEDAREDNRPRRQPTPFAQPAPRPERVSAPAERSDDGGSRIGSRSSGGAARARTRPSQSTED